MHLRFPASGIHTIRSLNVAVSRSHHDVGNDIDVIVPDGVTCTARVEGGVLLLEGTGGDVQGPLIMSRTISFSGEGAATVVQVLVPRSRTNIRTENHHS